MTNACGRTIAAGALSDIAFAHELIAPVYRQTVLVLGRHFGLDDDALSALVEFAETDPVAFAGAVRNTVRTVRV